MFDGKKNCLGDDYEKKFYTGISSTSIIKSRLLYYFISFIYTTKKLAESLIE